MNSYLRQSTASQSRALGPFISSTDFIAPMTALTIANTDIKLVVNGAASANKTSGGGTHRINGVYGVTFDATDTATVGELFVSVVVATALPVFHTFQVLEEAIFDALFAASAPGYLQPTVAARTLDVSVAGEAGIDWANIGSPGTTQTMGATTIGSVSTVGTVNLLANNAITSGVIASGAITAGKFAAGAIDAAAIATNAIDADALAPDAATELNAGLATSAALSAVATNVTAVRTTTDKLDTMLEPDGGVYRYTTNALEQAPTGTGGGGGATVAAIWDELLSGHTIPGSAGATLASRATQVSVDDLPTNSELAASQAAADDATLAAIAALNNLSTAQVQTAATAALTAYDPPTHAELTAGLAGADDATLTAIAGLNNLSQAQVQAASTAALGAYDPPTHAEMLAGFAAADDATLAAIAAMPTAPSSLANAEALLAMNLGGAGVGVLNERTVRSALRMMRNRWSIASGAMVVMKEDDLTPAWTANVSSVPGDPVNEVDPL